MLPVPTYVLEVYASADGEDLREIIDDESNDAIGITCVQNEKTGPTTVLMRIPHWDVMEPQYCVFMATLLGEKDMLYELISRAQALTVYRAQVMEDDE